MRYLLAIALIVFLSSCEKKPPSKPAKSTYGFTYYPPGVLKPENSGRGRIGDKYIYAPRIRFPIETAPAFINSQVYGIGGMYGQRGSLCDQRNFRYPWKDNYCEKRGWGMPLCPGGKGHQGVDIRPSTCEKKKYFAVAVEDGIITYIGKYTVYLRGVTGRTYRYLHLDPRSLQVRKGQRMRRSQRIGRVSNYMGKTTTSIHLHFDIQQTIRIGGRSKKVFVPPYTSLIDAYKRLLRGRP